MSSPKYASELLEKLGIPNTPAAKASRKAAEEVVMPVSHSQVNNKTRKIKIQQIKNAMEQKIARAKFLDGIEKQAEKTKRAQEIYNEWMRRAELKLRRPPNVSPSVRSSKNSSKSTTPKSNSKSPRKTRRNRS
jgi:hypothetical protein